MPFKIILMISGKAGAGKSALADILIRKFNEQGVICNRFSLGTKIKKIATTEFGWNGVKDEKGRQLLINIGDAGRAFDPAFWAKQVLSAIQHQIENNDVFLVDDWRFGAESEYLSAVTDFLTYKIRIFAPQREILKNTPTYQDASENSLPEFLSPEGQNFYNYAINNDGDWTKLEYNAQKIIDSIIADV